MDKPKSKNGEMPVEVMAIEEPTLTRIIGCGENGIVGYLHHKPTHNKIAVYQHIGWFQRLMIRWCFGLEYEVK